MDHQINNELPQVQPSATGESIPQVPMSSPELAGYNEAQANIAVEQARTAIPTQTPPVQSIPTAVPMDPNATAAQLASGMPMIADDADLIEKEWVVKAKEIVARTKHDPYQQNKEVERMKADYMRKRYNKEVKITED